MLALACLGLASSLLLTPDSTVVPMELTDGGRAVVPVTILGRSYRLAVETGSPNVRLSTAITGDLGLKRSRTAYGETTFVLDSLRIGDVLVTGLEISSGDEFARLDVDGVLGLDAYQDYLLTVDYPAARLVLSRGTLPEPDGKEILRAVRVGPFVGVEVDLGGVTEIGVVDTQGGMNFQALPEVADHLTFTTPLKVVGRAVVGGGDPVEVRGARLAGPLRIGRHAFSSPSIAVHKLPAEIPSRVTIGLRALRHFAITLDQQTMRVRFTRPDTTAIAD